MVKTLLYRSYTNVTPEEIQDLRERVGMTYREFARALGVTHGSVWQWENGQAAPSKLHAEVMRRWREELDRARSQERISKLAAAGALVGAGVLLDTLFSTDED